jgi:sialate O-acetylesterase
MPAIFSDDMVIQQNADVAVWGTTVQNEDVQINTSWGDTATTTADANGLWSTTITTGAADNNAETITVVSGAATKTITNVLVGEVWLASGQSNMAFNLNAAVGSAAAKANSDNNLLRLFNVGLNATLDPQDDVISGAWEVSSPSVSGGFSAVAYFFADKLQEKLGIPVAIIESDYGGSPVEAWMDEATLSSLGIPIPTSLKTNPQQTYAANFNGMINPIVGYNIKGAIWYQGEGNRPNHTDYQEYFTAMIDSWRGLWDVSDLPFYFVQIAPYDYGSAANNLRAAGVRQAQYNTMMAHANTGMAVTLDVGECSNIHPTNKQPVGERLANWALVNDYGQSTQTYPFRGPEVDTIIKSGLNLTLYFNYADSLNTGGTTLANFEVSANGITYTAATESIQTDTTVLVSSASTEPNYVRYAASGCVGATLFNEHGLPASPFTLEVISANEYALTVNSGTGDGDYAEGTVVNIVANAPASGYVFDKWTGGVANVADLNAASTTITMPAANRTVTATYVESSTGNHLINTGFETPAVSTYQMGPFTDGWTFSQNSGVQRNDSPVGAADAPEGVQTAFLGSNNGNISQTINVPTSGVYEIKCQMARRSTNVQAVEVYLGATLVGTLTPASSSFTEYSTGTFSVAAGANTIEFKSTVSGDLVAFLDDVYFGMQEPTITYDLTVTSGIGDGSYTESTVVDIVANAPASGYAFNQWTGGVANVADVHAATTTITMPAEAVELTATYTPTTSTDIVRTLSKGSEVQIYPNPANGIVNIQTTEASEVEVFNVAGQTIYNKRETATSHHIDVSNWKSGVYFVNIQCTGKVYCKKIIVNEIRK